MEPIYIVALISFIIGAIGYVITQFWFRPILRYRKLKRQIASDLTMYSVAETAERTDQRKEKPLEERVAAIRWHSDELSTSYHYDLPPWYRLLLQRRGEYPLEASQHLMKLSNTHNPEHAARRVKRIKAVLKIK